jgi:hypothetical protein
MPRRHAPSKDESRLLPPFPTLADARIHTPSSPEAFAAARAALLAAPVLGFDTESKPLFKVDQEDTGPHVVQLATPHDAWLLQLHHPEALAIAREVLAAPQIAKVGFGLDNDASSLPRRLGCTLANIVDLDKVFSRHGFGHNVGVRAAVALVLGQSFSKSKKTSTSNWSLRTLSPGQIRYAANDAHAPAAVWAALPAWEALQPATPVPRRQRPRSTPTAAPSAVQPPPSAMPSTPQSAPRAHASAAPATAALLRPAVTPAVTSQNTPQATPHSTLRSEPRH